MPLYHILKEGFTTLRIIHSNTRRRGNATLNANDEIFKRMNQLREYGAEGAGMSRRIHLPYTGKNVHKYPFEFKDDDGVRIFFKIEDQLEIANNKTLKLVSSKLNANVSP